MRRFNELMKSNFEGCRLLANAYDHCRQRDVKIYYIHSHFDVVGVTDGTDCWMAPTCIDPFSVSIKRMIEDLRNGKEPEVVATFRRRPITSAPADHPAVAAAPAAIQRRTLAPPTQSTIARRPLRS